MLLLLDPVITRDSVMTPVTQVASPFMDYKSVIACAQSLSENSGIRFGSSCMRSFLFQEILETGWGSWVVVLPTLKVVTAAQLQSCASAVKRTKQAQGKNAALPLWSLSLSVAQQYSFPRSFVRSGP